MLPNGLARQMPAALRAVHSAAHSASQVKPNTVITFARTAANTCFVNPKIVNPRVPNHGHSPMRVLSTQSGSSGARASGIWWLAAAGTATVAGMYVAAEHRRDEGREKSGGSVDSPLPTSQKIEQMANVPKIEGLPIFTSQEVAERAKSTDRVLVTLGNGVYDITEFVEDHPGGSIINLSNGKDLSKFWNSQRQHFKSTVFEILEQYRIGNLDKAVVFDYGEDPYSKEAPRELLMGHVFGLAPYNAEPEVLMLTESGLTPVDDLFVRNHKPMPPLDAKNYSIHINLGEGEEAHKQIKLDDLFKDESKVEKRTLVLACGGQRRSDTESKLGSPWATANGNVEVSGLNIKMLLTEMGLDWSTVTERDYLVLEGDDGYKSNIPLLEMPEHSLLANKMNGEPLTNDHGHPVRAFFEGYAGHFNIKRLRTMSVIRDVKVASEEDKYKLTDEKNAYKLIVDGQFKGHLDRLPLQSLFAGETPDSIDRGEPSTLFEGIAYAGSANIERVEVCLDSTKGKWVAAELHRQDRQGQPWVQWSVELSTVDLEPGTHHAYCRAFDDKGNGQPEVAEENRRGLGCNSYHRVEFVVEAE